MGNNPAPQNPTIPQKGQELTLDANNPYLRIVSVNPQSPEAALGLQPFLHFIVHVSHASPNFNLEKDFYQWVIQNEEREVTIYLYHLLTREVVPKKLKPSRQWEGADALLGIKVRAERLAHAKNGIFRVNGLCRYDLKGLLYPGEDFVLTAKEFAYKEPKELKEKMKTMGGCHLVVYSLAKQTLRFEELDLCNGSLGIEIGTGVLNDLDYNFALLTKDNKKDNFSQVSNFASEKVGLAGKGIELQSVGVSQGTDQMENGEHQKIKNVSDHTGEEEINEI